MDIYYEPTRHGFFRVEERTDKGTFLIGRLTRYYEDAKTVLGDGAPVSSDFIAGSVLVEALDSMPEVVHDSVGWRVKPRPGDWDYHLFPQAAPVEGG